ncbi:unnamed protein product [Allacma fusca]|uniref:CRAL-TRIO domain-containing protein n=1 Tax=Allacma fusca TaxID=39272 RepID=A0A8J2KKN3_9HEXA|nr:unnamed protein product [Allacma fusca]
MIIVSQGIFIVFLSLLDGVVFGEETLTNQTSGINSALLDWKVPERIKSKFPYYLSGTDYEGKPVLVIQWGRWDTRYIAEKGGSDLEALEKGVDQFVERVNTGYFAVKLNSTETEDEDELVMILDFDGFRLRQFNSPANMKFLLSSFTKLERIYQKFAYGFVLNANPLVLQAINLSKPLAGNFLGRMEIHGTVSSKWKPSILKAIPQTQLHPAYGGLNSFRPVSIEGWLSP